MSVAGVILADVGTDQANKSTRVFSRAQLAQAGITEAKLKTLVGRGALLRLDRGVYVVAAGAERLASVPGGSSALRVAAAVAGMGPQAVGSHSTAAAVHELDLLRRVGGDLVAVTRPPGAPGRRTGRPGIKLHIAALPPEHRTVRLGAPVTSVARTVVDLARTTSFREGVVVADSALRGRQVTKTDLRAVVEACDHWPGITRARQVVEFADARSESALESISRVVFAQGGLPPPELQVWVGADGRVIARVDFLWRKYATIAEADGAIKYADPERAKLQLQRDAELREAGFEVVHFTWQDLHINPAQVLRSIKVSFQRSVAVRAAAAGPGKG
jgi:hypothetical protein